MRYLPSIDGMRAIAISLVLISHLGAGKWVPGGFGVTLFFFISGYLITSLLLDEHARTGRICFGNFYLRRFMRLMPALATMIAVTSMTYWIWFHVTSPMEVAAGILYLMNYYEIGGGDAALPLGQLWSLAVEEHFYLLFPIVLAIALRSRVHVTTGLLSACLLVLVWRILLVSHGSSIDRTYIATDTRIDSILFGCALATAIFYRKDVFWLGHRSTIIAAAGLLFVSFAVRSPAFRETIRYTAQGLAIGPIIYFAQIDRGNRLKSWLEPPLLIWLGKLSYSLYLWHFFLFALIDRLALDSVFTAIFLKATLTLIVATASYYLIEKPLRGRRRRMTLRELTMPIASASTTHSLASAAATDRPSEGR